MENAGNFTYLNIDEVLPNRFQPRIHFDDHKLNELADSITKYGVIQPIVVRKIGNKYEIIAGERRYKASKLANKSTIPAIVINLTDKESEEIALLENVQRQNLTPIEEAVSYKRILDMGYITQEELAKKLGKTQSTIANKIRLLNLDDQVQYALLNGKISERHARSLLRIHDKLEQIKMLNRIIDERLTVKRTDEAIKELLEGVSPKIEDKKEVKKETSKIKVKEAVENLFDEPIIKKPRRAVAVASHEIIKVNPPKELKRKEDAKMNIDKIMQEAQDINVDEGAKDISNLMKQENGVSPIALQPSIPSVQPEPLQENTDVQTTNNQQNKFVNVSENQQKPEEILPSDSNNNAIFDNMFNQTPTSLKQESAPVSNEAPTLYNELVNNQPEMNSSQLGVEPSLNNAMPEMPIQNNMNQSMQQMTPQNDMNQPMQQMSPQNDMNQPMQQMSPQNDMNQPMQQMAPQNDMNQPMQQMLSQNDMNQPMTSTFDQSIDNIQPLNNEQNKFINVNNMQSSVNPVPEQPVNPMAVPVPETSQMTSIPSETQGMAQNNAANIATAVERAMNSEAPSLELSPSMGPNSQAMNFEPIPNSNFNNVPEQPVNPMAVPVPETPQVAPFQQEVTPIMPESVNQIPTTDIIESPTPQNLSTPMTNNFNEVINLIRECASKIEKLGYYIDVDEADLGASYQATFKINKE